MSRIGNSEWEEMSLYHDDYDTESEDLSPLHDDYVREEYRDDEW